MNKIGKIKRKKLLQSVYYIYRYVKLLYQSSHHEQFVYKGNTTTREASTDYAF